MGEFVKVCAFDLVPLGGVRGVDVGRKRILLSNINGEIFAYEAFCTHERADLSEGTLSGCNIVCPLHFSEFDLRTGEVLTPPAEESLKKFNVKLHDGEILVEL
ncbi:MAG: Rieske (2Fe-2S) protein [Nitrososphaerales archaeon]